MRWFEYKMVQGSISKCAESNQNFIEYTEKRPFGFLANMFLL